MNKNDILPYIERQNLKTTDIYKEVMRLQKRNKELAGFITIGDTMSILNERRPNQLHEWEEYYLRTGELRKNILNTRAKIPDIEMFYLNKSYGRTFEELVDIAVKTKVYLPQVNLKMILNCVYIYVIDNPWLGYLRESKCLYIFVKNFERMKGLYIRHSSNVQDTNYNVDFEICYYGELLCGIQLKGVNYKRYITNPRIINKENNFIKMHGVPLYYAYFNDETQKVENFDEIFSLILELVDEKDKIRNSINKQHKSRNVF